MSKPAVADSLNEVFNTGAVHEIEAGHKRCCAARHRRDGNPSKRSAATCVDHAAARFDGAGCALYLRKTILALRSIGSALRQLHPADDEAEGRVTATRQPESGT